MRSRIAWVKGLCFLLLIASLIGNQFCNAAEKTVNAKFVRGKVYWKFFQKPPFELKPGRIGLTSDLTILSFFDGQCFLDLPEGAEVRLKEDSVVVAHYDGAIEVRKGIVGIQAKKLPVNVTTLHAKLRIEDGTVVIKSNSIMTRISVVKGGVYLINEAQRDRVLISAGKEVAVSGGMYSKIYDQTAELRYTWYWLDASKEPGLKSE